MDRIKKHYVSEQEDFSAEIHKFIQGESIYQNGDAWKEMFDILREQQNTLQLILSSLQRIEGAITLDK